MPALWLRFPDEVPLPDRFNDAEKDQFERIFSVTDKNSPWNRALGMVRLSPAVDKLVCWHGDSPYFNWSALVKVISGGAIHAVRGDAGPFAFHVSYKMMDLCRLLSCQWKIARFMQVYHSAGDRLSESIALGLVLQSLLMRIGHDEKHLALWLSGSAPVPNKYRKTVRQMQEVQVRRTVLSPVWKEIFPGSAGRGAIQKNLPDYFWDMPLPESVKAEVAAAENAGQWTGLPVCAGQVTGIVVTDTANLEEIRKKYNSPIILVFRRARPETTELFGQADAVLFADGGILSHACTIARERNLPSITALGEGFFDLLLSDKMVWLSIDGGTGIVKVIK